MSFPEVQNFAGWVEENRKCFKPPVGNKLMHGAGQMKVMVVGGPNVRKDYHIEEGEEFFYMHEGNMVLEIMECGRRKSVPIKQGEMFMLPARIPHSPQREAGTVGLVYERERKEGEFDAMRWYVGDTQEILYEEWFHCTDLGTQLGPVIKRYFDSEAHKTQRPQQEYNDPKVDIDTTTVVDAPINFKTWCTERAGKNEILFDGGFRCTVMQAEELWPHWQYHDGETLLWQHAGGCTVTMRDGDDTKVAELAAGDMLLLPRGLHFKVKRPAGGIGMVTTNKFVADPAPFPSRASGAAADAGAGAGGAGAGAGSA